MSENRTRPLKRGKLIPQNVSMYLGESGKLFHGWEGLTIQENINTVANPFSFSIPQKFEQQNQNFRLAAGTKVTIQVNEETVIVGRIEQTEVKISARQKTVRVSGRSLPGDIVDCTHEGPFEYNNIRLDTLAKELLRPFGIGVLLSVTPGKIEKFNIKPGDTVFEALDRAARLQGFFWLGTRGGNIRLTRAARARSFSSVFEDINMKSGTLKLSDQERFSQYKVKGQSRSFEGFEGAQAAAPEGSASDSLVKRYRPLTIIEGNVTPETARTRAQWEASTRLAKAVSLSVLVQNWQQEDGSLWGVNQVMRIRSRTLGVDGDFLSTQVERIRDQANGTVTKIELTDAAAYTPEPVIEAPERDPLAEYRR